MSSNKYDTCISLGSGFSLLTYLIASLTPDYHKINFIDVDLQNILNERNNRIEKIKHKTQLNPIILKHLTRLTLNLEEVYQKGIKFKDIFDTSKSPIFILEGIIYFLSRECVQWIFKEIATFKNYAVVFDYWPDGSLKKSQCMRTMFASLNDFIPEQIKGLLDTNELNHLCGSASVNDISLQEVENHMAMVRGESPQLTNVNQFIPVRLRVITNNMQKSNLPT